MDFMQSVCAALRIVRGGLIAAAVVAVQWWAAPFAEAQVSERAEPVTGPGVTTIGGIDVGQRINLRSGPSTLFSVVGTLGYGTRVNKGLCVGGGSARWCEVQTMDGKVSGFVSGRFLVEGGAPPPDVNPTTGPDYWAVRGLASSERLGVRLEPKSGSTVLATLKNGEIVRNLGCRTSGGARWCRIRSITGMDVTGWVAERYLRESTAPLGGGGGTDDGGPDFYVVTGLATGDTLNVRSKASTSGTVIARLSQGAKVRNLGCERIGTTRWCQIRTTGGVDVTGWVNGRYLREG